MEKLIASMREAVRIVAGELPPVRVCLWKEVGWRSTVVLMEALAEQVIATYLTRGGKVFVVPQYSIPDPGSKGDWSCPDFVALDFEKREVVVVEVASGADLGPITTKAKDRERQWFTPLRQKLKDDGVVDGWEIRFLGFVRQHNLDKARAALTGHDRVAFASIESATFSWDYWETRIGGGLPR
jgi:hypothetical protein